MSQLVVAVAAAFALRYRSQTGQRSPTITGKTARAARSARCSTQDKERPSCSLAAALEGIRCACWPLEFPDGTVILLTRLLEGQEAVVLQLPAQPTTASEAEAQKHVVHVG